MTDFNSKSTRAFCKIQTATNTPWRLKLQHEFQKEANLLNTLSQENFCIFVAKAEAMRLERRFVCYSKQCEH